MIRLYGIQLCAMTLQECYGLIRNALQIIDAFIVYALLTCASQVSSQAHVGDVPQG